MNKQDLLIRRKTPEYPDGRLSKNVVSKLRNNVTIVEKSTGKIIERQS